jgi:hypothetical protein
MELCHLEIVSSADVKGYTIYTPYAASKSRSYFFFVLIPVLVGLEVNIRNSAITKLAPNVGFFEEKVP